MALSDSLNCNSALIGNLSINSWNTNTGSFSKTETADSFALDANAYAADTFAYDANGNQTYDGTQTYTYDAWNRLRSVAHAYRDSSGVLQSGQVMTSFSYDGRGRRVGKAVNNTWSWDCAYDYYLDKDSVIEERNGSNQTIKQFVWGKRYIDELVQTSINSDPTNSSHQTCDVNYWALQDANWNVLGVVDSSGVMKERYEYTPYGQRTTFISPGTNDPYCMVATMASQRVVTTGSVTQPYGICEVGHQGLMHDEECGLVYNRARTYSTVLQRWMQRDCLKCADSLNLFEYELSDSIRSLDPSGFETRKSWTDQEKRKAMCEALNSSDGLKDFVDKYDPTFGGSDGMKLRNLEMQTVYGDTDIDWMITLLAAHEGRSEWIFKHMDPENVYAVGKEAWTFLDWWRDGVPFRNHPYGQPNEINAIKAARSLINGKISLKDLFSGLNCDDKDSTCSSNSAPPSRNRRLRTR